METVIALWLLGAALVAVGIAGMLLPALPGPPLLFAGFVIAAWAEDFERVGVGTLTMLGVMCLLAVWSEVETVRREIRRRGFARIDVTDKSMETLADEVIRSITRRLGEESRRSREE